MGGAAPHALKRAAAYGDGWLPIGMTPERLPGARAEYAEWCAAEERPVGEVVVMGALPADDSGAAAQVLHGFHEGGASRFVVFERYADGDAFRRRLGALLAAKEEAGL